MIRTACLLFALLGFTSPVHAEETELHTTEPSEAVSDTTHVDDELHPTLPPVGGEGHSRVISSLHAGVAFRFDFEEVEPGTEPFLVVGAGVTIHLNERIGLVPLLTAAVAPTGTWGFGVNTELEAEVWKKHLAVDILVSVYQETNIHKDRTEFVFAHGLGLSAIFGQGTTLTVGGQIGVDLESGKQAFYPYFDIGIPIPIKTREKNRSTD